MEACVLDGGLATELERRGADLHDELWSARVLLEDPELIRRVHLDYFEAGAQVATTASYQASFEGLSRRGLDRQAAAALMRRSVELARSAAEEYLDGSPTGDASGARVAASVGPYGATLADGSEYRGDDTLTVEELADFHRPRIEVLAAASPDFLAIETLPSLREAEAILRVLDEHAEIRSWLAFSCRDAERISDGSLFAEAVAMVSSLDRIVGVGVNCTAPAFVHSLLIGARGARGETSFVAYPNAGSSWDPVRRTWGPPDGSALDFGEEARRWLDAGATFVGGCCGTGPTDIAAIAQAVAPLRLQGR
jgi:homocysteine S-methyltransferase